MGESWRNKGPKPFSENESKNVRDIIFEYKPVAYVNNHTWGGHDGLTIRRPHDTTFKEMFRKCLESIALTSKIPVGTDTMYHKELKTASSYNWAGKQLSSRGTNVISTVFEVGSEEPYHHQTSYGVNGLLVYCMYIDNYLTKGGLQGVSEPMLFNTYS